MEQYEVRLIADLINYRVIGREIEAGRYEVTVLQERSPGIFNAVFTEQRRLIEISLEIFDAVLIDYSHLLETTIMAVVEKVAETLSYDLAELGYSVRRAS